MAVTQDDSARWASVGTKDAMARTYAAVEAALAASDNLSKREVEIFLQGSYANATNIRGDSDVDVVVMLKSTWSPDKSLLSSIEKTAYDRDHSPASYTAAHLRADVITALKSYFGTDRVEPKKKAIRVNKVDG